MDKISSYIFEILLLFERYHQNSQAVLVAIGMNGLGFLLVLAYESSKHL